MSIKAELEVARADMNDALGVTLWQHKRQVDYTADEARELAREIAAAADEADRVRAEMEAEANLPRLAPGSIIVDGSGKTVL